MRAAVSCAVSNTASSGTTRQARPISCASAAPKVSPSRSSSRVFASPTMRGRIAVTPPVGNMPHLISGKKHLVPSPKTARSQLIAHSSPPPTAQPWIAPTTTLSPSTRRRETSWIASMKARVSASPAVWFSISLRSSPEQKARPAPRRTSAPTPSSASAVSSAVQRSASSVALSALSRSGRLSVSVATPAVTPESTVPVIVNPPGSAAASCRRCVAASPAAAGLRWPRREAPL